MSMKPTEALKYFESLIVKLTSKVNRDYRDDAQQELRMYVVITAQKSKGNIKTEYLEQNLKAILAEFIKKQINKGITYAPELLTKSQIEDNIRFNHYEINKLDNVDRNIQALRDKHNQRNLCKRKCQNNLTKG